MKEIDKISENIKIESPECLDFESIIEKPIHNLLIDHLQISENNETDTSLRFI